MAGLRLWCDEFLWDLIHQPADSLLSSVWFMIFRKGVFFFFYFVPLIYLFLVNPWDDLRGKLCSVGVERRADTVGPKLSGLWEPRNNRRKSPFFQYWPIVVLLTKALRGSVPGFVVRICGLVASVIAEGIRRPGVHCVLLGRTQIIFAIPSASDIMLSRV